MLKVIPASMYTVFSACFFLIVSTRPTYYVPRSCYVTRRFDVGHRVPSAV